MGHLVVLGVYFWMTFGGFGAIVGETFGHSWGTFGNIWGTFGGPLGDVWGNVGGPLGDLLGACWGTSGRLLAQFRGILEKMGVLLGHICLAQKK